MFEIPTRSDLPAYEFTMELDGSIFTLRFRWNARKEKWMMDVHNAVGGAIISGIPVMVSRDVLKQYVMKERPKGVFLFSNTTGIPNDPGRNELGNLIFAGYFEEADLA